MEVLLLFFIYWIQSWDYEYSMHTLNILSLNVNDLNSAVKRTRVLEYLHCESISCALIQRFSTPVLAPPPRSAHFACLCCLNTPDSDHQLIRRKFHEWTVFRLTCSLHSVHCSLLPKHEKSVDVYFTSELIYSLIYSRICATPASSHTDETY